MNIIKKKLQYIDLRPVNQLLYEIFKNIKEIKRKLLYGRCFLLIKLSNYRMRNN